jgi:alkylation response protein AidB-like acyl-CoA dehydrogenase
MDFSPTPRTAEILATAQRFVRDRVLPLEAELLAGATFKSLLPKLAVLRDEVRAMGLFLPQIAKDHGGAGLSLLEHAQLSAVLGQTPLGHFCFHCQAPDAGNMELLVQHGSPAQKDRWLKPLLAGEIRSCFSMTEPEVPGSNPTWLRTRAVIDGDAWVVDGHKWFTTSASGASFAIVMAVTDPDAAPHAQASMILVPTDTKGFVHVRNVSVMGHAGDDWDSHAELRYEGCRVPKENLVGPRGGGFMLAQERLGPGRIHHCMRWIGICERALSMMSARAATRLIAPGKPLGTKQIVQEWIADSAAEIHGARLMVLHAAWKMEREGAYAARAEISMIKYAVAGVLQRVLDRAIQAHGALGMTDDTVLAWFFRQERAARIYDGPDEVHKTVVAKRILKAHGLESS